MAGKAVKLMGYRTNAAQLDFSEILPEEVEAELKEATVVSMGTEVSDLDLINIKDLCDQVLSLSEYRAQFYDYLKSRMNSIAPNLTALVGDEEVADEATAKKDKKKKKKDVSKEAVEVQLRRRRKRRGKHAEADEEETETPSKKKDKKKKKKSEV